MTILLGLTGSIGMGKSTVAAMFRAEGVPVFDADATVHMLQGPGGALVDAIEALHPGVTGPDGVDRARLGAAVLGDTPALRRLEAIVHPAVHAERLRFLNAHGEAPLIIFDIPLLLEGSSGTADTLDAIIVVSAPAHLQRARVLARPGMTEQRFGQIFARQLPDAEKRARADFVIETGVSPDETRARVADLVACLKRHGVRYCKACERSSSIPKLPD